MYKIIWEKKKLLILSKGIDEIESNISIDNLPSNKEIEEIINDNDKGEIKIQTQKKWNCICKNKPGLNQDMWKLIQEYSEEFNTDYIIQIKNEIINFAILKLYNIIKENHFDLRWYDSSEPDYRWAHNTILRSKEEIQKIMKIKKKYIEN